MKSKGKILFLMKIICNLKGTLKRLKRKQAKHLRIYPRQQTSDSLLKIATTGQYLSP